MADILERLNSIVDCEYLIIGMVSRETTRGVIVEHAAMPVLREARDEIERLRKELDSAFKMSKCECEANECCANLARLHSAIERLGGSQDER